MKTKHLGFSMAPGTLTSLSKAGTYDEGYIYRFSGDDLSKMGQQEEFLVKKGFDIGHQDVYPAVKTEEEYVKGLQLIYENKVDGWWIYHDDLLKFGVCTHEEYTVQFDLMIEASKKRVLEEYERKKPLEV